MRIKFKWPEKVNHLGNTLALNITYLHQKDLLIFYIVELQWSSTMKTSNKNALLILVSCMILSCRASDNENYTIDSSPSNNTHMALKPNTIERILITYCSRHQDVRNFNPTISINEQRCFTTQPFTFEDLQTNGYVCRITNTERKGDFQCRNISIILLNNGLTASNSIKVKIYEDFLQGILKAKLRYNTTFVSPAPTVTTDVETTAVSPMNPVPIANNDSLLVALSVALGVIVLLVVLVAVLAHRLRRKEKIRCEN